MKGEAQATVLLSGDKLPGPIPPHGPSLEYYASSATTAREQTDASECQQHRASGWKPALTSHCQSLLFSNIAPWPTVDTRSSQAGR